MTRKSSEKVPKAPQLPVEVGPGETLAEKSARLAVTGVAGNAYVALTFGTPSGMLSTDELGDLHKELKKAVDRTKAGGTEQADELLSAQAVALNQIFVEMARRAAMNMGQYLEATDTYLRLALKAQSQCRSTLESLAEIRNPRQATFVRQANIAGGHQQVNNGTLPEQDTGGSLVFQQNKVLEESGNVTRLDARTERKAG